MILDKVGFPLQETKTNVEHVKYLRKLDDVIGGITLHTAIYNQAQKGDVRSSDVSPDTTPDA
jgi:hypothetical protein